jgi:hypothetical protein
MQIILALAKQKTRLHLRRHASNSKDKRKSKAKETVKWQDVELEGIDGEVLASLVVLIFLTECFLGSRLVNKIWFNALFENSDVFC